MPTRGSARRAGRRAGRRAARRTTRRRAMVMPVMVPRARRRSVLGSLLILGGTAAVAYKIGQDSVKQVEQYTGKSFDSLSGEELASAIDALDIDLPADEADQTAGEAYDDYDDYEDEPDYIDELERLAGLKQKGIITEEEFQTKKKQLLGQ